LFYSLPTICRFANDVDLLLGRQQRADPLAHDGVIIDHQHADIAL
jgi:hypothetical protein